MGGRELVNYNEEWAKQALGYAEQEKLQGGTFLSTRGGILSFGDETLPGNQACVIVLDAVREKTYYGQKFNPDQPAAPICYAFGRGDGAEMARLWSAIERSVAAINDAHAPAAVHGQAA